MKIRQRRKALYKTIDLEILAKICAKEGGHILKKNYYLAAGVQPTEDIPGNQCCCGKTLCCSLGVEEAIGCNKEADHKGFCANSFYPTLLWKKTIPAEPEKQAA